MLLHSARCHFAGGLCACDPEWGGPDCATKLCPGNCTNGNGVCLSSGVCQCKAEFMGKVLGPPRVSTAEYPVL